MGIIDRLFGNDGSNKEKSLNPNMSSYNVFAAVNGTTLQGYDTNKFVTEGYLGNADVYAIVSFLARKCASVPWYVYRVKSGEKGKQSHMRYKHLVKGVSNPGALQQAVMERKSAYEENVIMDSPLARLLERPNSYQGQDAFFQNLFGYRVLSGEGNIYCNDAGMPGGKVLEMNVLPTQYLQIYPDPNDLYGIVGYKLQATKGIDLPKDSVIAWKSWNPEFNADTRTHLRGVSPIRSAYRTLRMNNNAADASAMMSANGGAKGALTPKVINNVVTELTTSQAESIKSTVNTNLNGIDNKGRIGVLQTPWEYLNFGLSSMDMELMKAMQMSLQQWCRVFGLPAVIFDTDTSSYNNYQNGMRDLMTNTVIPMCCELRDELNKYLVPRFNEDVYIDFDVTAIPELQQDMERMSRILRDSNWLTMDEKRVAMNYERKGGAFEYAYVNQGLVTLEQVEMDLSIQNDNSNNNGLGDMANGDGTISQDTNGTDVPS